MVIPLIIVFKLPVKNNLKNIRKEFACFFAVYQRILYTKRVSQHGLRKIFYHLFISLFPFILENECRLRNLGILKNMVNEDTFSDTPVATKTEPRITKTTRSRQRWINS